MKFSKYLSTIFLATAISLIYLFSILFWFYTCASGDILESLKESLSTTSSFFGGITTLIAAYVAVQIFKEWKKQARYLDSIKLISRIKKQIKKCFYEINNKRNFFIYQEYYVDLGRKLVQEGNFDNFHTGILSGPEKAQEVLKFKDSLYPIDESFEELNELVEELSTYLDVDPTSFLSLINQNKENTIVEITTAHTKLMQFIVGSGTLPNPQFPKTVDIDDLQYAQTILQQAYMMDSTSVKHTVRNDIKNILIDEQESKFFLYDNVLKRREDEILNTIKGIRNRYVE